MPYEMVKEGDKYLVKNKDTGRVVGTHEEPGAKEKAEKQVRLLEAVENDPGWE